MKKMSEPIVFFGSGPVAADSLRLLAVDYEVEAIITKPRAPHHHGPVPVLSLADELKIPVHTVETKAQLDTLFAARPFRSRLGVLIDFGIIVSQQVINYFPKGIINSHFSLLPEWRGADPITFSILSGQQRTGVSLMLLVPAMDEGPILSNTSFDIPSTMTTPELTKELINESNQALHHVIPLYLNNEAKSASQAATAQALNRSTEPTYSRKLTKQDGEIDWRKPAERLEREIRAYIEWPKSKATFDDTEVTITKATVVYFSGPAGTTAVTHKHPIVYCGENALQLDRLKPAGKKEMTGQEFLAGYRKQFLQS
ncbi:MAG TPA: methionyl-tRNA formyltransferase [Bacillota bacterium]|nr:methionyl-tRNA formyltransferase [Bacillota bacterium]HSX36741.1 methionyl-tRNA formyltransferase [Patescibacteria group bacterium]